MKVIQFTVSNPPYYPTDVAGFTVEQADSFIERKMAFAVKEVTILKDYEQYKAGERKILSVDACNSLINLKVAEEFKR